MRPCVILELASRQAAAEQGPAGGGGGKGGSFWFLLGAGGGAGGGGGAGDAPIVFPELRAFRGHDVLPRHPFRIERGGVAVPAEREAGLARGEERPVGFLEGGQGGVGLGAKSPGPL